MRATHYLTLLFGFLTLVALSSCSRESSVKEDVSLKNNHSRVFAQREAFEDPKAFADSMANTAFNASDSLADTLTVTVNDTVYLMGILPRNVDKIYLFQWNLTKANGKDTTVRGNNATPLAWSYAKTGVYYPLFIAFDGNNSTDTAGTDTKRTYIKVIDTKPVLTVPKDTLWTSNKGEITFPITARDSFGTIKKVLVDLDASGKDSAKVYPYETKENNDSLYITIKNDPKKIDSLGNQKIYVTIVDDDNNKTTDSVNLHFNRIPKLKVLYPLDGARHNISERFYFYYEGTDSDNPQSLKYFIYAQVSKNGQPPVKAFDSNDLIAEDYTFTIFEPTNQKGENVITLVNNPTKELTGRIYWDMYVTDGYDIVHMDRVSTGAGSSRPWSFYIGDLKSTQGSISGVAVYQGRTNHSDIDISLSNGMKTFTTTTGSNGIYSIKVDAGSYTAIAKTNNPEYKPDTLKDIYLESGATLIADSLILLDTLPPALLVKNIDTLTVRELKQTIYARDLGSHIKSVSVLRGKENLKPTCAITDQGAIYNCQLTDSLTDGIHNFTYTAIDSAGNKREVKQAIFVSATKISLSVNGAQKQLATKDETLLFKATIEDAYPAPDSVTWAYTIGTTTPTTITKRSKVNNGVATFELKYEDFETLTKPGEEYAMVVSYTENDVNLTAKVKFGRLGNDPAIIFTAPGDTTVVTMNDPVTFRALFYPGISSTKLNIAWDCGSEISSGYSCPEAISNAPATKDSIEKVLAFKSIKLHKVKISVTDDAGESSRKSDSVFVKVISDRPSIDASLGAHGIEYKINATADVTVNAKDKFGTINEITWGCSNGNVAFDYDSILPTPTAELNDFKIKIHLPGTPSEKHKCVFKAIDDDGEEQLDTLKFVVLLDPPTLQLAVKRDTVKINSNQLIKAFAEDRFGYIAEYAIACDENLKSLSSPSWEIMSSDTISRKMPSKATSYYCVVRVKDDDSNIALDTAAYVVLVGRPTVTAVFPSAYETVTINDTLELNAIAQDSLGTLKKYEWGCGPSPSNVIFTNVSTTSPRTTVVMPSTPYEKYYCVIRVTDDDGNTAIDSVHARTKVILAPPTVTVSNKTLTVREGYNITLNAEARDSNILPSDTGSIVKREWSCGTPSDISKNWKTVSSFDTVWKAPAPQVTYNCIARATDNDGNIATDTTNIKFSTDLPVIQTKDDVIYVNIGDAFSLSATVNDVWQGIDWFSWECIVQETKKSLEKDGKAPKYDYKANGGNMTISRDSSYSMVGKDMYCIVKALEHSTQAVFSDTTEVRIMKQHPKGVITAADTVYVWSGDSSLPSEAMYFYTEEWGGMNSQMGELGDKNNQEFKWRFSNVDGNYYKGDSTGRLDTLSKQFNKAFIRSTNEGSRTFYLDYRDSITESNSQAFFSRHRAEEVKRTIYFRKAWRNLAKDTVIESTGTINVAPAIVVVNDNPAEAYLTDATTAKIQVYKNGTWTSIGTIGSSETITKLSLATDGTSLYIGVLGSNNEFTVYKSTNATSAPAKMGSAITNVTSPKVLCTNSGSPIVIAIRNDDKQAYLYKYSTKWTETKIAVTDSDTKWREIDGAFYEGGKLAVVTVDVSTDYNAYSSIYSSSYSALGTPSVISNNVNKVSLAASGTKIYMGFSNRDVNFYGPYVYAGTAGAKSISWNKSDVYGKPIYEGYIAYHMSIVVNNGIVYAALDDNGRSDLSQTHVFKLEKNAWHFYGENELPYFGSIFYERNKYYLRGSNPQLAVDGAGKVYLSMLARENVHGGSTKNNGPIVMKYVADNWEIH